MSKIKFKETSRHLYRLLDEPKILNQEGCDTTLIYRVKYGYPVAEGSADWALYQMIQGKKVAHRCSSTKYIHMHKDVDAVIFDECNKIYSSIEDFAAFGHKSGWEIYEETLPSPGSLEWAKYSLLRGEKVRLKHWSPHEYIHMNGDEKGSVFNEDGRVYCRLEYMLFGNEWELYEEPETEPSKNIYCNPLANSIVSRDPHLPLTLTECERIGIAGFCKECFAENGGCPNEPKPAPFAHVKVGDRVEIVLDSGKTVQREVLFVLDSPHRIQTSPSGTNYFNAQGEYFYTENSPQCPDSALIGRVTRILMKPQWKDALSLAEHAARILTKMGHTSYIVHYDIGKHGVTTRVDLSDHTLNESMKQIHKEDYPLTAAVSSTSGNLQWAADSLSNEKKVVCMRRVAPSEPYTQGDGHFYSYPDGKVGHKKNGAARGEVFFNDVQEFVSHFEDKNTWWRLYDKDDG